MNARNLAAIILLVSPVAIGYCGQDVQTPDLEFQTTPLRPLDARVEDVGVLSTSLRVESSGLGEPSGFDAVYKVPGGSGKLMRVNGALFAVFDRSIYQSAVGGTRAVVPPSTVFHIGVPPGGVSPGAVSSPVKRPASMESEQPARIGYGTVPPATSRSGSRSSGSDDSLPRFVADREYRSRRLAEILEEHLAR